MSIFEKQLYASCERDTNAVWATIASAHAGLAAAERSSAASSARAAKASLREEQLGALQARARARAAARRASFEAPRESRPPWEWLPPPPHASSLRAPALLATMEASVAAAPGASGAQFFLGEVGAMPLLRRLRQAECAAGLREGVAEARLLGALGREDAALYAAALRERGLALLEEELRAREAVVAEKAARRVEALGAVRSRPPPHYHHTTTITTTSSSQILRLRKRRSAPSGQSGRKRPRFAVRTPRRQQQWLRAAL
jgi:hypothetical protein